MDHEHQHRNETTYHENPGQWVDPHHYHPPSHHQSPVNEYSGFAFSPMPMEPMYTAPMQPPRTTHQQLQPLIMPQWPSMLTSQSSYGTPLFAAAPISSTSSNTTPVAAQPATTTPISATSTRSSSTPRKTLTDADRRKMCLYHEENPTVKQTEIGGEQRLPSFGQLDLTR